MSKATKRKHVTKETLEDYYVPENGEEIVKIIASRGNNLHEVEASDGRKFLISMPTKFRKNVWVKRGDFVVVTPIEEGKKVQGEMVYILYAKQIKYLKDEKLWPENFDGNIKKTNACGLMTEDMNDNMKYNLEVHQSQLSACDDDISSSDDDDLFENPNHRPTYYFDDDSETSDEGNHDKETSKGGESPDDYGEEGGTKVINDMSEGVEHLNLMK